MTGAGERRGSRAGSPAPVHKWDFLARFRRNGFGWRSQPAVSRVQRGGGRDPQGGPATADPRRLARSGVDPNDPAAVNAWVEEVGSLPDEQLEEILSALVPSKDE